MWYSTDVYALALHAWPPLLDSYLLITLYCILRKYMCLRCQPMASTTTAPSSTAAVLEAAAADAGAIVSVVEEHDAIALRETSGGIGGARDHQ